MPKQQTDASRVVNRSIFCIAITIVGVALICCAPSSGKFSLVNKAPDPIARASVTVCGQTIELKNIPPSKRAEGSYRVTSDSHYSIQIEFESGKKLAKETGYVTSGASFDDEIVVSDSTIEVTNRSIK